MSEIENLKIGNGGTLHIVGNEDIIANEWEAGQVYIENRSYVIREHKLLMCNTTHTSVEPFDPDKWTEKNIGEALGTAGSANMIECTLAEYTAWKAGGQLINETVYVITDAPNLNATAQDISYDGGATSTHDVIEGLKVSTSSVTAGTSITINRQRLWKMGKSCFLNLNCATSASLNGSSKICDLPSGFSAISGATFDLFMHDAINNTFYRGAVVGNKVQFNTTATIPSGAGLCINVFWYTA